VLAKFKISFIIIASFLTRVNLKSPFVAKCMIYVRHLKLTFVVVQTDSVQLVTVKLILNLW